MPINWNETERNLENYLNSQAAESISDTANFITNVYLSSILTGTDIFGNVVVSYNDTILKNSLEVAFNVALNQNKSDHFSQYISNGLIGFWTGAQLSLAVPPPGAVQVITNVVSFPGNQQTINIVNSRQNLFAKNLINVFRLHSLSLRGTITALVPSPAGPVPTQFFWTGYQ